MSDKAIEIRENLIKLRGKPADYVTHFLKTHSGGEKSKMVDGLIDIVDTLIEDKMISVNETKHKSKKRYGSIGFLGGIIFSGSIVFLHKHIKKGKIDTEKRKQNDDKCDVIIKEIKTEVQSAENSFNVAECSQPLNDLKKSSFEAGDNIDM